ncbi:MAG: phycobiliprotein lyase [Chroococcales cyanobacterium]
MTLQQQFTQITLETLVEEFFRTSEGQWHSQRRYYTLPEGKTKEMTSMITVKFLNFGSEELRKLEQLHSLHQSLRCGASVSWNSSDSFTGKKQSSGFTIFGVFGNKLYRDRGFATPHPVTADYFFPNSQTLCLKTEYKGSMFEEELRLIGHQYRTRQTIISCAGEQKMIGQYLEKRIA